MPRVRLQLPVEIDVSDEELAAGKAVLRAATTVGDLVTTVRASGLSEALAAAVNSTRKAVRSRRRK